MKEKDREGGNIAESQGKELLASPKGLTLFVLSFLLSSLDYVGCSLCLLHLQGDLQTELGLASKMAMSRQYRYLDSFLLSPIISFICLIALRLSRPNIRTQGKQERDSI